MLMALIMAVVALKHRRYPEHGAWMIRAYALGMGAGTQVFTHLPWFLLVGKPHGLVRDTLMAAGWLINVCVAEWVIRRTLKLPMMQQAELKFNQSAVGLRLGRRKWHHSIRKAGCPRLPMA